MNPVFRVKELLETESQFWIISNLFLNSYLETKYSVQLKSLGIWIPKSAILNWNEITLTRCFDGQIYIAKRFVESQLKYFEHPPEIQSKIATKRQQERCVFLNYLNREEEHNPIPIPQVALP